MNLLNALNSHIKDENHVYINIKATCPSPPSLNLLTKIRLDPEITCPVCGFFLHTTLTRTVVNGVAKNPQFYEDKCPNTHLL